MKRSSWWMIIGIITLIGGVMALANPLAGSLAATIIAGWCFLMAGVLMIVAVFSAPGAGNKVLLALFGALMTFLGWSLLAHPLEGVLTLTVVVGILLISGGIVRLITAFDFRGGNTFWMMLLSSLVSFLLAFMIFADFPASAASILGILLGVELIFNGVAMIALSSASKKIEGSAA